MSRCKSNSLHAYRSLAAFLIKIVSTDSRFGNTQAHYVTEIVEFASGLCAGYPKESRASELKVASIDTIVLATLFLFLRLYSRWLKTRRLWSDDAYAIIAAVSVRRTRNKDLAKDW